MLSVIRMYLEHDLWSDATFRLETWDTQAGILARYLNDDEWSAVSSAVDACRTHAKLSPKILAPREQDEASAQDILGSLRERVELGRDALTEHTIRAEITEFERTVQNQR